MNEVNSTSKKEQIREWLKLKAHGLRVWFDENKELVLILGPIVVGGATTIAKVVGRNINLQKEKNMKDLYCYDRSLGHYWALRRELSNSEWIEVDRRKRNGERLADILHDFRVLK